MTDVANRITGSVREIRLQSLALELTRRGFTTDVGRSSTGTAQVHVVNPDCPALSDHVLCALDTDDALRFFWPWGKRISDAQATAAAADEVARVLGT